MKEKVLMKTSSKKTMLTAAVLVALSSGTTYAATPGTVDTQELFHSDHLVTDHSKKPAMEETAATDRYEASISQKKNLESAASAQGDLHGKASVGRVWIQVLLSATHNHHLYSPYKNPNR